MTSSKNGRGKGVVYTVGEGGKVIDRGSGRGRGEQGMIGEQGGKWRTRARDGGEKRKGIGLHLLGQGTDSTEHRYVPYNNSAHLETFKSNHMANPF